MPSIGRIQSTNFQALLDSLGITRNNIPFDLRSEVSPVVLVGGTVSFIAAPTPPYAVTDIFTAGQLVAPIINTALADTGPLPVGAYTVQLFGMVEEVPLLEFQWRNAGNSANLWTQFIRFQASVPFVYQTRLNIENASERFRVINTLAGAVGVTYQVSLLVKV